MSAYSLRGWFRSLWYDAPEPVRTHGMFLNRARARSLNAYLDHLGMRDVRFTTDPVRNPDA